MKKTFAASALTLGMLAVPLGGTAFADPTDVYPAALNGAGSDTTEVVMRDLDFAIDDLGSWDATATRDFDTNGGANGCDFAGKIFGSGDGTKALANSLSNGDNCFQFARSSSRSVGVAPANISTVTHKTAGSNGSSTYAAGDTYTGTGTTLQDMLPITLGVDGLSYVFRVGSGTPRDLTLGQLRGLYNCQLTTTVDGRYLGGTTMPNQMLLPTDSSGTRKDWLTLMGYASNTREVSSDGGDLPTCLEDGPGDSSSTEFAEHHGNVLTNGRQIIMHGLGQYIAQGQSATGDFRGLALLGYINGNTPLQQYDNPAAALTPGTQNTDPIKDGAWFRNVYNLVPSASWNNATIQGVFGVRSGGSDAAASDTPNVDSGEICLNNSILIKDGFIPVC